MTIAADGLLFPLLICGALLVLGLLRSLKRWLRRWLLAIAVVMVGALLLSTTLTDSAVRTRQRSADCLEPPRAVLYVYRSEFPNIAEHIARAQASDRAQDPDAQLGWSVLCRNHSAPDLDGKSSRAASFCGRQQPRPPGMSCDEYPFASTWQGGEWASFEWVPQEENNRQGGALAAFYKEHSITNGDTFGVIVI